MDTIGIVDGSSTFDEPIAIYGDLIYPDKGETRHIKLPYDWTLDRTMGNGIIRGKTSGKWWIYIPKVIMTRNKNAPSHVNYIPIAGKPEVFVPITKLADVRHIANYRYSITPASNVIVKYTFGETSKTFRTRRAVNMIDVRLLDPEIPEGARIEIRGVY
jgi:hypothetical protein